MKTNKLICAMFCICMFFCGCMTTIASTTSSPQSTTQSLINVQRKDNSEPLKIGTIVHYSGSAQTIFSVKQVLNNEKWTVLKKICYNSFRGKKIFIQTISKTYGFLLYLNQHLWSEKTHSCPSNLYS